MDEARKSVAATEKVEVAMNAKESKVMPIAAIVAMLVATMLIAGVAYLAGDIPDGWSSAMAIGANRARPVTEYRSPGPQTVSRVVTPAGRDAPGMPDLRQRVTRAAGELPGESLRQRATTWTGVAR